MNFLFERASSLIVAILVVANDVDASVVAGRSVMSWLRGADEPVRAEETVVTAQRPILQVHRYNGVHIQPLLEPQPAAFLPPPPPAPASEHIVAVPDQQMINVLYEAAPHLPEMGHLHEVEFAPWQPYIQAISEESFDRIHETVEAEGEARVGLPSKAKILKFLQLLKEKKLKPIRDAYQMKKNLINSALNLLHPIPPPPPPPPSSPVAPTFYYAPGDAIVVEAAAPSVYDRLPPPPPPPSPVFVLQPSLHFAPLPPPSMPHMVHHPVPEFPTGVHTFFEHPRFHELADVPFPPPPPFVPVHLEEIHTHAHESPSMDVILGHDLHAEASENVEHFSPSSANITVPVARMEVVEESHDNAVPTQNSTMPAVVATGESQTHERHGRSLDKYKYELPEPYILKPYSSRRPRSVPALTPLDESMQVEPTRRPPPSLEPVGEFTQLDDVRRPTRQALTKPCECEGPCKHDREARNLVDSAEFQDIRRPPPALEPLGEPTELDDARRPKRHVVDSRRPVDYIGYRRHRNETAFSVRKPREVDVPEPVVNSTEPQDIRRPPSANEYAKVFQQEVEKALEHSKWKYLVEHRINETANHSLMERRMRHLNFVRSVIESSELQDIRRAPPALEPITIREPREVDVPEPVVNNSSAPQDVRTSSPAVEPPVQSTEANDIRRPKRHVEDYGAPVNCVDCKQDRNETEKSPIIRRPRELDVTGDWPLVDIWQLLDVRTTPPPPPPPPVLEAHVKSMEFDDERRSERLVEDRIKLVNQYPIIVSTRKPRQVDVTEPSEGSKTPQDIRRPSPALEPITIREPREVDIPEPVINSSAPQDVRTSSPAVEPLVQSTEANDTLRPKRLAKDYGAPVNCVDCKQDGDEIEKRPIIHRLRELDVAGDWPLVDSWQLLDVRPTPPPPVLEAHVESTGFDVEGRSKRHGEDRIIHVNQYPIIISTRKPRQVDVTEPSVESTTPQDIRRPMRRIREYSRVPTDDGDEAPLRGHLFPGPPPTHPAYSMLPNGKPVQPFDIYHAPRGDRIIGDDDESIWDSRNT